MSDLQILALVLILAAAVLAFVRLVRGATTPDRVVAADAVAVITTPAIAWLALGLDEALYLDVALVYGALSFVGVVAIARTIEGDRS
jgi:multisubunit Na+/H+ antiporter MnhF subunit